MEGQKTQKIVYCHFSFRRPKDKHYGIFAVALYADKEGKRLVAAKTRAFTLWKNHQHVTAIQAYEHALYCIWEWQSKLLQYGVTNVMLVTDNSTLAGWIENPRKNKYYIPWMNKANSQYKAGGPKEIWIPIGLCEPRDSEKSHKFCTEDRICNKIPEIKPRNPSGYKLQIDNYKSVDDVLAEDKPEGIEDIEVTSDSVFVD